MTMERIWYGWVKSLFAMHIILCNRTEYNKRQINQYGSQNCSTCPSTSSFFDLSYLLIFVFMWQLPQYIYIEWCISPWTITYFIKNKPVLNRWEWWSLQCLPWSGGSLMLWWLSKGIPYRWVLSNVLDIAETSRL